MKYLLIISSFLFAFSLNAQSEKAHSTTPESKVLVEKPQLEKKAAKSSKKVKVTRTATKKAPNERASVIAKHRATKRAPHTKKGTSKKLSRMTRAEYKQSQKNKKKGHDYESSGTKSVIKPNKKVVRKSK